MKGLKNLRVYYGHFFGADIQAFTLDLQCLEKYILSSCLILWKLLPIPYFTGSRIRIPIPLAATQRELGASIQPLKLPTVNHPPVIKSNTVTRFKIISGLRNSLQNYKRVPVCRDKQFQISKCQKYYSSRDTIPLSPPPPPACQLLG
jgi:hypothetical protein